MDVLVGTQLAAKGLDLPSVTLAAVIAADVTLNLPDYLAPERTFQLLAQVAGRAGRGPLPGARPVSDLCRGSLRHPRCGSARRRRLRRPGAAAPPAARLPAGQRPGPAPGGGPRPWASRVPRSRGGHRRCHARGRGAWPAAVIRAPSGRSLAVPGRASSRRRAGPGGGPRAGAGRGRDRRGSGVAPRSEPWGLQTAASGSVKCQPWPTARS